MEKHVFLLTMMELETIRSKSDWNIKNVYPEQTNTCSKTTIETLEQGGKYVQS